MAFSDPLAANDRTTAEQVRSAETCEVSQADPHRVADARASLIDDREAADLAETFRVLGDPTRVRIVDAISRGELCVCDIAAVVGQSESAVSHQLRLLRGMRLVRSRRQGRMVYYTLDDQHILDLFEQGRRHIREELGA